MLRRLGRKEMAEIYDVQMQRDFPQAELKPWKRIGELLDGGSYFACGMYEKEKLMAYAFFVETAGKQALLDYYAVSEEDRGTGVGSRCMALIREELRRRENEVLVIEVENPEYAGTQEERRNRERRIRFYEKNGARATGLRARLFGVEYRIMYLPIKKEKGEEELRETLEEIYHTMFPERYFGKEVILRVAAGASACPGQL